MNAISLRRPGRPSLSNEQLLDRALDLFLEQGFDRTSIEAICQAAGMAKRTVYSRYGDKQTLFKAALQRAITEWIVPVERLRSAECGDLEQSLLAIGEILLANIMSPAGLCLLRLTNAESGRLPEIGANNVQQGTEPTIAYLADLFSRRLDSSMPGLELREAAEGFLHLITGPAIDAAWGVRRDEAALARHVRYSVKLFLYGLLAAKPTKPGEADNVREQLFNASLAALEQARETIIRAKAAGYT
jgi:TetR/AcrR family transcriptional regulator, mexJK operon transcriptional repressor